MKKSLSILLTTCFLTTSFFTNQLPAQQVIVTPHPRATEIAEQILNNGGNAVDAAVSAMFALAVVQPWAAGPGGSGEMVVKMRNRQAVVISFRERAPIAATTGRFYRRPDEFRYLTATGYRSVCTPGMVAGATKALETFGTLDASSVLTPVIKLARKGFEVTPRLNKLLIQYYDLVERYRATADIFMPDWLPVAINDTLKREDLAVTLEILSMKGLRELYVGEMARDISDHFNINDGFLSLNDLQQYRAIQNQGISGHYKGYKIVAPAPPSSGGAALIALLGILENQDIKSHPFNSGAYLHTFVEALKLALIDRRQYQGDPKFEPVRTQDFLTSRYLKGLAARIDSANVYNSDVLTSDIESSSAAHISIIDAAGNAVSVTQSLGFYFGAAVTHPGTGILFNNGMYHFSADSSSINSIQPRKVPATSLAPTIVLKNGKPVLILGSSGADRTISTLAQIIVAVLDFGLDIEEAVAAPRFHYENGIIQLETRIESDAIEHLKKLGHKTRLRIDYDPYFGIAHAIHVREGVTKGAADPRGEGSVGVINN